MLNETKFDNDFISEIKKKVINYIAKSTSSINKITFNLSLYTQFILNDADDNNISVIEPTIKNGKINPAVVSIDAGFFKYDEKTNEYYIKPEAEDIFSYKLIYILIMGASLDVKYEGNRPVKIISNHPDYFVKYTCKVLAEDINNYIIPDLVDKYSFNKKIVRMIMALVGKNNVISEYLGINSAFNTNLYTLSEDEMLYSKINKNMEMINDLISTSNNESVKSEFEEELILKAISNYKHRLINMLIDELYIPYVNNVALDQRKIVRDEILKGFLGFNYVNLKLTEDNKDSYYWASIINNTVPINNKIGENAIALFKEQIIKEDATNIHDLNVKNALNKAKNNIKEFFVFNENGNIIIKSGSKKTVKAPHLVEEILSYAYINSIDEMTRKKVEGGIIALCNKGGKFKCSLKSNPLNNKMLVAGVIQLARKNGFNIKLIGEVDKNKVEFEVLEQKK